ERLRDEAERARAESDALEAAAGDALDEETFRWISVRLRRFLDSLREEGNDEISSLIAARVRSPYALNAAPAEPSVWPAIEPARAIEFVQVIEPPADSDTRDPGADASAATIDAAPVRAEAVPAVTVTEAAVVVRAEASTAGGLELDRDLECEFWADD